jgi:Zn-dependent M16 (insulinase) family peptidase
MTGPEDPLLPSAPPPEPVAGWIASTPIDVTGGRVLVFTSPATGLRALLIQTDESLCSLHVVIATEADTNDWSHKDDGLPHTLEHAIFMGSEYYPYKGILDKLANRCCADGTNAWTATDHTCYTLTTAGAEGCLSMLPIYADHILYPTLTDECFLTEVHHVTGEGEDKGVVYCEMQGRENSASSLIDRAVLDLLYPTGGLSAETGGKLKNLRTLTNAQVRRYHAENYRADNIAFVVSGTVDEAAFLAALAHVDARVASKPRPPPRARPWTQPVVPLNLSAEGVLPPLGTSSLPPRQPRMIEFPSEDESCGTVSMAWRGPRFAEQRAWLALKLLWKYLTDSAASPLQKAFVECEEPLCGDVASTDETFSEGYHQVWFEGVEVESIEKIVPTFFTALAGARDAFDMERMGLTLRRFRRVHLESLESHPADVLVDPLIRYFLYEPPDASPDGLRAHLDPLPELAPISQMTKPEWQALIDQYILHTPCCAVVGRPSARLAKQIEEETKALTKANVERLGPDGLRAQGEALERAVKFNERPIDEAILTAVPIPEYAKVRGPPAFTLRGGGLTLLASAPGTGAGVPEATRSAVAAALHASADACKTCVPVSSDGLFVEWTHVESAFVTAAVAFDTSAVPASLRLYLPLLLEMWWKLPACLEDGTRLPKDAFVAALEDDTVNYSANFGQITGRLSQLASISVKVELEGSGGAPGLATALMWLRRSLYLTTTSLSHVKMAAKNMASRLPAAFREGSSMVAHVMGCVQLEASRANVVAACPMQQQPFVARLLARLVTAEGAAHVLAQLGALRALLLRPDRMQVLVACNLTKVLAPYEQLCAALAPPPPGAMAAIECDDEAGAAEGPEGEDDEVGEEEDDEEGEEDDKGDDEEEEGAKGDEACAACDEGDEGKDGGADATVAPTPKSPPKKVKAAASPVLEAIGEEAAAAAAAVRAPAVTPHLLRHVTDWSALRKDVSGQMTIAPLASIESAFLVLTTAGVSAMDADVAPLRVMIEHLSALEGDFWVKLRGAGLTYGSSLSNDIETRALSFSLYRCADALAAYKAAKQIVVEYATGVLTISPVQLAGAKSSLAYSILARTSTKASVINQTWSSAYLGVPADYDRWLLQQLDATDVSAALHTLRKYIVPLFDASANLSVTCPPSKVDALAAGLEAAHGGAVCVVPEEQLNAVFGLDADAPPPQTQGRAKPLPAFAFAKQFGRCECPRCGPPTVDDK